ncbi:MAG: PAS domain S-box protein [Microcoleus vaginatus WJT46-NPBG5]|jgi:PAS domain S-box-containing protein|nr:PAS domain S-box protein [Microcoleus vaginatus WJT46-NPBG5]
MMPDPSGVRQENSQGEAASERARQKNSYVQQKHLEITLHQTKAEKTQVKTALLRRSIHFILTATGFIRSVNQRGAACLGYTVPELRNKPIFSIFHPDDRERMQALGTAFLYSSAPAAQGECRLVCKDGSSLWVKAITLQKKHRHYKRTGLIAEMNTNTDPLMLILCEELMNCKQNERHFRATFECASIGIAHIALNGRLELVNQWLCDIVDYTAAELQSLTFEDITHPDDRDTDREEIRALLAGEIQAYSQQKRLICKDSLATSIKLTVSLARENNDNFPILNSDFIQNSSFKIQTALGKPKYFIALIEDITARKQAETELQESASAWLTVIETVGEGLTVSDGEGRFEVFNSKMEEITGYTKEEANHYPDFISLLYPDLPARSCALAGIQELSQQGGFREIETRIQTKDGVKKTLLVSTSVVRYKNNKLFLSAYRDITERKQMEEAICIAKEKYRSIFENAIEGIFQTTAEGQIISANPAFARLCGYESPEELLAKVTDIKHQIYVQPTRRDEFIATMQAQNSVSNFESQIYRADGSIIWISENARAVKNSAGEFLYYEGTIEDITARRQAHEALRLQTERERLIAAMSQRIRQSLNLRHILSTTVEEVRQFLATDRVLIYRFNRDNSGVVEVESRDANWLAMQGVLIEAPCFPQKCVELYKQGHIGAMENIETANLTQCHIDLLLQFQVRANLVVPILLNDEIRMNNPDKVLNSQPSSSNCRLWGLLIAHHCREPRRWIPEESELLKQLATQVGIAIQQSELHQQLRLVNVELERQVRERTGLLRQALDFEAMLKRITDKVRDSLDESQILKTVVRELVLVLGVECCDTALYSADQTTATVCYEYGTSMPAPTEKVVPMANFPGVYKQLLAGEHFQFCALGKFVKTIVPDSVRYKSILACPIVDDQGVLGDLWLFNQQDYVFNDLEIRLVQQVANQCAIGIRQARLYEESRAQVEELQKLSWLKDEFLSTVSHELRTPLSNMKMAIQMLAIALNQKHGFLAELAKPEPERGKAARYFQILQTECEREISLINDLLDLQRLEATAQPCVMETIELKDWLPALVKPFYGRVKEHEQILQVDICDQLPALTSDPASLGRIVTELLNNACKYTPPGERIIVKAGVVAEAIYLSVNNTGVEIPADEVPRIFDKFYRVPKTDRWQQGGTGLGLTLVKKLVNHLGGSIQVESAAGQTIFTVALPLSNSSS